MRSKIPGPLAWAAAGLAAVVAAAVLILHTPPVTRWSRDWIVRQVAERWDLDLAASRLTYNLLTGRVTLEGVRLAAPGHAGTPFFVATRVTAVLPWVILRGTVRLSDLRVDAGHVRLVRENGVLVNLPPSSGKPPPETARRFDLRGLQIRGLDVDYVDRTGDVDVQVRGLRADLTERDIRIFSGASGAITAAAVTARIGDKATTSGAVTGRLAFDGSNVSLQALTLPFPEATVVADGRINRVLDDAHLALTLAGTLDLAAIAAWTPPPVPVSGGGTFTGTFSGPLSGYELRADFASEAMTIARVPAVKLTGVLALTSPRAVIAPLTITTPPQAGTARRGVFDGQFVYTFGERGGSDLTGAYRDLDLDMALALYDQDPVTVAAWEQGTISLGRDTRTAPLRMHATGRSTPQARVDRVALDGTWDATLRDERWVVDHEHRLLDSARAAGTLRWRAGGAATDTALAGPVTLDVTDVGAAIRAARRSGIGVSASLVDLTGTAHGVLTVGGTLARTVVTGRIASSDLVLPHGAGAAATADLVYDEDSLSATAFALETPGARVTGRVRMDMASSRLAGDFAVAVDSLPEFLAPWGDATGASGEVQIAGTIGGTTDVPDVPLRLQSTPVSYGTQPIGSLAAEARLFGTDLRVDRLVLDQGPGQLRVAGHVDYDSYAYDATVDGRGLTWARPLTGGNVEAVTMDIAYAGGGTLDAPGGAGAVTIAPTGGLGDFTGPADIRWQFAGGTAAVTAFWPKLRAWAQADVEPRAPYAVRGTALVSRLDVQPIALTAGALTDAVSGTVDFSVAFAGALSDVAAATAFVNLQAVDVAVGGLPLRLDRPVRITVRPGDYSVDDLALQVGGSRFTLGGRFREGLDEPLRAAFTGETADVAALARAFGVLPAGTIAAGALTAGWESRGSLDTARATLSLADGTVTIAGLPPIDALAAAAVFDGTTLAVETLTAQWQGGSITGTARLPRQLFDGSAGPAASPGRVDLAVVGLTEKALAPWLPAATVAALRGRVSATLGLDLTAATVAGINGTLVLDEAEVIAEGVPLAQTRPSYLSLAGSVLTFDDVEFGAGVPVRIGGNVTFGDSTDFNVWITGTPSLRPLSVLSPQMAVDGAAVLDLWLTGTPAAPRVVGTVTLDDAEVVMRDPSVIASDLSGPIVFTGDRFSLSRLTGFLNGGDVEASGAVQFAGVDTMTGEITVQARGVAVEYPRNVDSEIDALLVYVVGTPPLLRGDVRILRSAYRATISLPALVAFNATRVVDVAAGPSFLDQVRLDVAVSTEEDMIVDNNYGRFEAGADVRLQGTVTRPGVTGRAELREGGEIFLLNGVYRLNASTISFTDPTAIQPEMNITMVTPSGRYESSVTLSGTLERLQTTVTSTNPDADPSLLNVLLGGSNSLTGSDAVALLSGELLGVTGRALGLDALRIERGFNADFVRQDPGLIAEDADPTARLTVSKRLSRDVEVILSRKLSGSGDLSAVVSYRPWRGVELRGTSRDNNDRAYAVRHEISFGGGAATAAARARPTALVGGVRITGAAPDEEPALRAALSLREGKRFDFIAWREDAERLQAWYHERGFLEARVRPSRGPGDSDGLQLTYGVVRGPRTELVVTGTTVSPRLRRELEQAWSRAVFDGFRRDELRRSVAYDLVRRDIIGARVDATVTEPAVNEKRIEVVVQGGDKVSARVFEFPGAAGLTAKELEATLRRQGLEQYVWVDPSAAVAPVQSRYREAGFREAAVSAGEPRVAAGRAVLPIAVVEGPLTTVAQVRVTGVGDDLAGAVNDIVRPLEGGAFRSAPVDDARRRIESLYRARGFNHVEIVPAVAIAADHRAEVTIAVRPGPQQRLQAVVVDATGRTRPSAVVSALRLEPGAPVDLAKWAEARKRVFDTNVFRQVEVRPEVVAGAAAADGSEPVNARVTVTEWPAWRLRYGLQLNDTDQSGIGGESGLPRARNLGAVADLQNRNAFGRAFTFGLYGRVERRLQSSNAYLTFPTLFGRAVQTNIFGSAAQQDTAFDDNGDPLLRRTKGIASIEQRVRRGRGMEIAYGYRYSREVLRPFDSEDPFFQETLIGRFTASTFFDRRDDPFDAARGWFGSLSVERLSFFGFDSDSVKVLGSFYRYQPLGPLTLASAARIGTSFVDPLLFAERFFAGGGDTVRGYAENAIGPTDFTGLPAGGNAMLVFNQEVRAPLYKWVKGVVFVDAGNVFPTKRPTLSDLQVGYGAGLRFNTPFSLFRLDFGVPAAGGGVRWYLGIGQVF